MSSNSIQPIALPLDGERFVPGEMSGNIELEHRHRYLFALQLVRDKVVLDIACGEGYGSALLATSARRVIGVDIAEVAVEHARQRYQAENLEFLTGSCAAIPLPDRAVDVVVSFETIEHHAEHEAMMCEVTRVLRPGGLLVISSPDKEEYSDKPRFRNPFHVRELYKEEFRALLSAHFRNVTLFGQRVVLGSMLLAEQQSQGVRFQRHGPQAAPEPAPLEAMYWVAMASNAELPAATDTVYGQPTAAFWAAVDQPLDSALAKLIRMLAAPGSEHLSSCLRSQWYLQQHPDLVAAAVDPYEHWIEIGADEGRLPSSDPLALAQHLLLEREQLAQQSFQNQLQPLTQTVDRLQSQLRQSAERERQSRLELADLQERLQQTQAQARESLDQRDEEALKRLQQAQSEADRRLQQAQSESERRLQQVQSDAEDRLQQAQQESQERLERARKELLEQRATSQAEMAGVQRQASERSESHLRELAEREQALTDQLLQQQATFRAQQAQLAEAADRKSAAQAAEAAERERSLRQEVFNLRERLQQAQRQAQELQERSTQREQAFAAQLLRQQEKSDTDRAALSEAMEQRHLSQATEHIERERQLRQDIQGLQDALQQIHDQWREGFARQHREFQERLDRAQQASVQQLTDQRAAFDTERAQAAEATEQKLAALTAQHAARERRLRHDLQNLQERLDETQHDALERGESQLRQLVEREQAFAGQLLQQQGSFNAQLAALAAEFGNRDLQLRQELLALQERSDVMMAEDRATLQEQYSRVLTDLKKDLQLLRTSMSWRLAAPLRAIAAAFGSRADLPQVGEIDTALHWPMSRDRKLTLPVRTKLLSRETGGHG